MLKKVFLFLLLAFGLTSCNIEDLESDDISAAPIQGLWKLTELNLKTPLDINGDNTVNLNILDETSIIDATLTFNNESSGSILYRSWISFSTIKEEGKLYFLPISSLSSDHAPEPFSYFMENDLMTINTDITFNKGHNQLSLLTLEGNKLMFTVTSGFVVKDETTLEETVNQDLTYVFTRQ